MNPRFGVFVLATAVLHTEAKSKNLTSFRGQLEGHAQEAFRDRQRSGGIQQQGKRRGSWTAGPRNETSRLMKRKKSLLIFRFAWKGTPPVQQAFDRWRTLCANRGRSWQTARLGSFTQFSLSFLPPWLVFIVPGFWSGFGRGSAAARPSGAVEPPAVGERRGRTAAKGRRYFEGFRSGWLLRAAGAEQAQHHPGGSPVIVLGRAAKGGAVVVEIDHADFPVFPDAHIDSASGLIRKAVIRGSVASGAADGDVEARSANQAFHKTRYVPAVHSAAAVAAAGMVAALH